MARLKDIARETGLSVNTVSLALRDSPRISQPTRERIRAAAEAMDYRPNHIAKSLVSRRTQTIGLVLTDITSPVLTQVAHAVERTLTQRGYATLFAASGNDPAEEGHVLDTLRARQVEGMLVYPCRADRLEGICAVRRTGLPIVLLAGAARDDIDVLCVDERLGARRATEHLIAGGHRRIGLIDGCELNGNREKQEGYRVALEAACLPFDPGLVVDPCGASLAHGARAFAAARARPGPPTAVLVANDPLALGGLRWCQTNGVAVPSDLAVCGFDNTEYGMHAAVPLTSVDYPVQDLALRAVERLLELVEGRGDPSPRATRIAPRLVRRESTLGVAAGPAA